ncbi:chorismate mutase [Halocynthiibacter sp. C4]|uniref:chorismate mutase n=1 Tax=Halocynthiibacter sp. C4 TaxID=2992758 RepID=UPI00237BBDE6|nr:chorismate mutase [Halocynthiibacter sp. C4]MDE0588693.1 chorismate mutase [Halocynthiibacter sp. C4]
MREPKDCENMEQLRAEIDTLDAELIKTLRIRASYIDRAAEIKKRDGLAANIPVRVEEVVGNVRRLAEDEGLSPDLAESLWRELIRWSIAREEVHLNTTKE